MACNLLKKLVGLGRLELPTRGLGNIRSDPFSLVLNRKPLHFHDTGLSAQNTVFSVLAATTR